MKRDSGKTRRIWKSHYGEIPKDDTGRTYEIHHIDRNPENNSIENLICIPIEEHYQIHLEAKEYAAASMISKRMNNEILTGWSHTEETKKKISKAHKGKKRGPLSEEHKAAIKKSLNNSEVFAKMLKSEERRNKISKSKKGVPHSEEHKAALKAAQQKRFETENGPMFGKTHSIETRKKMSESAKGRIPWNKGKKLSEEHKAALKAAHKKRKIIQ